VPDELTSTTGIVALVAGGLAVIALVFVAILLTKIRRLQAGQKMVLGDGSDRDLITHAASLESGFEALRDYVEEAFTRLDERLGQGEQRLEGCISRTAVIRYDAYGEMTGRQSSSMALLDETGTGVVMSAILHREQARLYVKDVSGGNSEYELSPEEHEAIQSALARGKRAAA
jgi:hypothetical protein